MKKRPFKSRRGKRIHSRSIPTLLAIGSVAVGSFSLATVGMGIVYQQSQVAANDVSQHAQCTNVKVDECGCNQVYKDPKDKSKGCKQGQNMWKCTCISLQTGQSQKCQENGCCAADPSGCDGSSKDDKGKGGVKPQTSQGGQESAPSIPPKPQTSDNDPMRKGIVDAFAQEQPQEAGLGRVPTPDNNNDDPPNSPWNDFLIEESMRLPGSEMRQLYPTRPAGDYGGGQPAPYADDSPPVNSPSGVTLPSIPAPPIRFDIFGSAVCCAVSAL